MAYKGNPSTDVGDEIRLLIGDLSTSTGSEIFADGEMDYFSASYANAELAASAAVKTLIGTTRGNDMVSAVTSKKVGDLTLGFSAPGNVYLALREKAKQLRMLGVRKVKPYAGGISQSDKKATQSDTDLEPYPFRIGQFDHPGIGVNSTSTF